MVDSNLTNVLIQAFLFKMVGGLGIFLLGMKNMSEGMQAVAGNRLRSLIGAANVTFFEVPAHTADSETPHRIEHWYQGRDVGEAVRSALASSQFDATAELLGATTHGSKGERQLFKITRHGDTASPEDIVSSIAQAERDAAALPANRARLAAGRLLRAIGLRNKDVVSENE